MLAPRRCIDAAARLFYEHILWIPSLHMQSICDYYCVSMVQQHGMPVATPLLRHAQSDVTPCVTSDPQAAEHRCKDPAAPSRRLANRQCTHIFGPKARPRRLPEPMHEVASDSVRTTASSGVPLRLTIHIMRCRATYPAAPLLFRSA